MKKVSIVIILFLVILLCGCESKKNEVIINNKLINTSKMEHKYCTREATLDGGEVKLEYDIYYTGEVLNLLVSKEKIISSSEDILNTYEEAYKKIHLNYEKLENYDTSVVRGDTTVLSTISINYDKVDIDYVIKKASGEYSTNIFINKVPKVDKWLELAKKFGTTCELVK